jgi:hypothetical protein
VRLFVYEGYAYSLLASLLGTFVGLGIAAGLVWGLNRAAESFADLFNDDLTIPFHVEPSSLLVAASSGLLITFLAVLLASIRIGSLGVVIAIRNLPEERGSRRPRLALQGSLLVLGVGLAAVGFPVENGYLMLLGPFFAVFGIGFLLNRFLPARPVWSTVGGRADRQPRLRHFARGTRPALAAKPRERANLRRNNFTTPASGSSWIV